MSLPAPPSLRRLRASIESLLLDRGFQVVLFLGSLVVFWLLESGVAFAR